MTQSTQHAFLSRSRSRQTWIFPRHLFKIILPNRSIIYEDLFLVFLASRRELRKFPSSSCTRSEKKGENFPQTFSHFHFARAQVKPKPMKKKKLRVLLDNANINTKSGWENIFSLQEKSRVIFPTEKINFHSQIHLDSVNYRNLNISVRSGIESNYFIFNAIKVINQNDRRGSNAVDRYQEIEKEQEIEERSDRRGWSGVRDSLAVGCRECTQGFTPDHSGY